jgi:hypothetical protein
VPPTEDADAALYDSSAGEEDETETLSAGSRHNLDHEHDFDDEKPAGKPKAGSRHNHDRENDFDHEKPAGKAGKVGLNLMRTVSVDPDKAPDGKRRKVPPPLSDWNRSQSFPPPGKTSADCDADRKCGNDAGNGNSVFGGRPLTKGVSSVASSVSCASDIEGKKSL